MSLELSAVISAAELSSIVNDPAILIIDVSAENEFTAGHIEGAVQLDYAAFVSAHPPVMGLLPDADQLSLVFSSIGLTTGHHVVAYDRDGGGKAGRLIYTLDAIGHTKNSLLDGGLQAWITEGHGTVSGSDLPVHTRYQAGTRGNNIADKDYIQSKLGEDSIILLDCRTADEFSGADVRAAKGGHIPGAVNFNWTDAMDPARPPLLRPEVELTSMFESIGVSKDKEVIAYCQTHHRSSHTYVVLKQLGYQNLKGYPGAWSDWGNDPDTPVET